MEEFNLDLFAHIIEEAEKNGRVHNKKPLSFKDQESLEKQAMIHLKQLNENLTTFISDQEDNPLYLFVEPYILDTKEVVSDMQDVVLKNFNREDMTQDGETLYEEFLALRDDILTILDREED